jgi:hypothetical protein
MAALVAVLVALTAAQAMGRGPGTKGSAPGSSGIKDEGVGTYTDPSVANQISNFTINREMVSCGVGTLATRDRSGPFAMLMYATIIEQYRVDRSAGSITVTGTMRSITHMGGETIEDVEHRFTAIAVDAGDVGDDRFDVHFRSPFWNAQSNPMCTPSSFGGGQCRFGGATVMGEVTVAQ